MPRLGERNRATTAISRTSIALARPESEPCDRHDWPAATQASAATEDSYKPGSRRSREMTFGLVEQVPWAVELRGFEPLTPSICPMLGTDRCWSSGGAGQRRHERAVLGCFPGTHLVEVDEPVLDRLDHSP